jgi:hypothetical protein
MPVPKYQSDILNLFCIKEISLQWVYFYLIHNLFWSSFHCNNNHLCSCEIQCPYMRWGWGDTVKETCNSYHSTFNIADLCAFFFPYSSVWTLYTTPILAGIAIRWKPALTFLETQNHTYLLRRSFTTQTEIFRQKIQIAQRVASLLPQCLR